MNMLTYVTYSEWQYKNTKIQKPNWNQKVFKSNGFTVLLFFSLIPLNGLEVTGKIATTNMFILLTYVTYSEWQYKKYKNTETKLKSKSFEIQWVYSFCVFFFNPSEWLWRYRENIYHKYVHIVVLCHLLGMTIQKYKNTETKLKSKSFQIQWVYSFIVFFI